MAARSEEEAKSIATTQAVIPVELHAVKNRYGPLSAGARGLLPFDRGHGAFRQQRSAPVLAVANSNGAGVNPPSLQLINS